MQAEADPSISYVLNVRSRALHKKVNGRVFERCNLDDAHAIKEVAPGLDFSIGFGASSGVMTEGKGSLYPCRICFPEGWDNPTE